MMIKMKNEPPIDINDNHKEAIEHTDPKPAINPQDTRAGNIDQNDVSPGISEDSLYKYIRTLSG